MSDSAPRKRKAITQEDLADDLDLSVKTISYALRAHPSVAPETARRVREYAAAQGYKLAVSHNTLGIIAPFISHLAYEELITALRAITSTYDYISLIGETAGEPELERRFIGEFRRFGTTAGIVLISPRIHPDEIDRISVNEQPIVTINLPIEPTSPYRFGSVDIDQEAGAHQATTHLIKTGHRRIVYLAGRLPAASDRLRRRGYLKALEDAREGGTNIGERIIELGGQITSAWPDLSAGYERCQEALALFSGDERPDAILAYNDVMAIGAMRALAEHGRRDSEHALQVPGEVSVIGFDNLAIGQFTIPSLSTIGVQWNTLAWEAWTILRSMIDNSETGEVPRHRRIKPGLVLRNSVAARTDDSRDT